MSQPRLPLCALALSLALLCPGSTPSLAQEGSGEPAQPTPKPKAPPKAKPEAKPKPKPQPQEQPQPKDKAQPKSGGTPKPGEKPQPTPPAKPTPKAPAQPKAGGAAGEGVPLFPLSPGRRWTYKLTFTTKAAGETGEKAGRSEDHRVDVFVATPQKLGGRLVSVLEWRLDRNRVPDQRDYYRVEAGRLLCVRRLQGAGAQIKRFDFEPPLLVLPQTLKASQTWEWAGSYGQGKAKQKAEVTGVGVKLEVPAGTFSTTIVKTVFKGERSEATQTRWLAPGVGVVKEVSEVKTPVHQIRTQGVLTRFRKR